MYAYKLNELFFPDYSERPVDEMAAHNKIVNHRLIWLNFTTCKIEYNFLFREKFTFLVFVTAVITINIELYPTI